MRKQYGFTLIELLTVVVILGILTAIALPQYRKSVDRATAATGLASLKTVFDAAKRYKSTHSTWPTRLNQLDVDLLDASEGNVVGEFHYEFYTDNGGTVGVCREAQSAAYCLWAHYRLNGQRDVYTCQTFDEKHRPLCDAMCSTPTSQSSDNQCVIE